MADFGRSLRSSRSFGDSALTFLVEANVKNAAGALLVSNGLNSTLRTRRCFALGGATATQARPVKEEGPSWEGRKKGEEHAMHGRLSSHHDMI